MAALRRGEEWDEAERQEWWLAYYRWLEPMLFQPGRWAIMPDSPGAPSQLNDGLLNDWPFGRSKGAPVWHMDGPIERLLRLCERYERVCLGWIGHPKREPVGCGAYRRRMDEVARAVGNTWPVLHMLRGIKVAFDYPFASADSTSLAQNGHRYDDKLNTADRWAGRRAYADRLENPDWRGGRLVRRASQPRRADARPHMGYPRMVDRRAGCDGDANGPAQLSFSF